MLHENGISAKAALDLAQRRFAVFPVHYITAEGSCSCGKPDCQHPGKHPMTPNGFKDAISDPAVVERMFRGPRSSANIGVATGPESGIWVLDEDGPAAAAAIADLEQQHGPLPKTVSAITGRDGGRHRYFAYPADVEVKSRSKIELPGDIKTDIDIRGAGGYVIVPPSNHVSGKQYQWEHSPETTQIAEAPAWLLGFVVNQGRSSRSSQSSLLLTVEAATDDLATAPGAAQGQRHDTALRLIGGEIGRGTDPAQVARLAVAWGQRCTPPMDEQEVLQIVKDLIRKDGTKITAVEAEVEAAPLPEPAPWPVLADDAYYGLAGEIVRTIEPETEADPAAILLQLLTFFGNAVGREPHFLVEGTKHHANVFVVLVGSTARGRKGTSEGRVQQIFRLGDEAWVLNNIKTGLVSGEGLIWNVRDPIYKTENIRKNGRIVGTETVLADPGVDDKRLLVVEPEFAAVLRVCRRETNTLSPTIRSAWDSGVLRTLAKNSPAKATDAHVSIVGHITLEELRLALADVDGFNGFANRFLWPVVRRSKLLPDGGQDLDLGVLGQRLAVAVEQARSVGRMQRDEAAATLWQHVYRELADDNAGGLLGAVTSRAEAQVLRLSMIYALLDGDGTIREPHLRASLAVWGYCRASAALIFGKASGDPIQEKALAAIRQTPGLGRREIYRALGNHVKADVLVSALARLRDTGMIRVEKVPGVGTKLVERWFPCEQRELANLALSASMQQEEKFANSQSSQTDATSGGDSQGGNFASSQSSQAGTADAPSQQAPKFASSQSSHPQPENGSGMEVFEL